MTACGFADCYFSTRPSWAPALPQIVRDLGGESSYVWGITACLVPATVLLPVFARLSDRYGRQRMLLVGMGLFVFGSALCAIAQSMAQVATFRAVQGAGAAALEALSFLARGPVRRRPGRPRGPHGRGSFVLDVY